MSIEFRRKSGSRCPAVWCTRLARFAAQATLALSLASSAAGLDVPGTDARVRTGGHLEGLAVVPSKSSPRQRPQALLDLWIDGDAADWLRAHVEMRGLVGGPFEGAHAGIVNFRDSFQNLSPSLDFTEAYLDFGSRSVDLRVGIQKFAWGKLDGIPPTDVLNPRSYRDPFVQEIEEAKIGIPAAAASYYPPDLDRWSLSQLRATMAYIPFAVPSQLPLVKERWFPPSTSFDEAVVPADVVREAGLGLNEDVTIGGDFRTANNAPPRNLAHGAIALRLSGTWRNSDWDVFHYTGPATSPNATLEAELTLGSFMPPELPDIDATVTVRQRTSSIHMWGAGWGTTLGPVTIRAEAAYFKDKPYLRSGRQLVEETVESLDPDEVRRIVTELLETGRAPVTLPELFVKRDAIEWGLGADCLFNGFFMLLQVNQIILTQSAPILLIDDPNTSLTGLLRRSFLGESLELELRSLYSIERGSWLVFPRASYLILEDLRARIGYLALGGPRNSLFGQYRDNDEFVFQLRYSF